MPAKAAAPRTPACIRDFEENSLVALPVEPDAVHIILSFDDASQSGGATTFRTAGGAEHTAEHTPPARRSC